MQPEQEQRMLAMPNSYSNMLFFGALHEFHGCTTKATVETHLTRCIKMNSIQSKLRTPGALVAFVCHFIFLSPPLSLSSYICAGSFFVCFDHTTL